MRISKRTEYHLLLYLIYPITGFSFGIIITLTWEKYPIVGLILLIMLILWMIILVYIILRLKCPNCHNKLNKINLFGLGFNYILPKKCTKCGYDLSSTDKTNI